ncbi:flippase (plasmid) [Lactiplantibacillus plantarum 16]|nr:flippase [Lactiplantibacillus plantarum 16]
MFNQLRRGLMYTFIGQYGNVLISVLVNVILSRLLTPHQYGIIAVIMVFIVFFQLLSEMGLGPAIIQNKSLSKNDLYNIFSFSIVLAIVLAAIFALFGFLLSYFYNDHIYIPLSLILSIAVFFYSLVVVPSAILKKRKAFKYINISLVVSALAGGLLGVFLAFEGAGAYSLVLMTTLTATSNFFLLLFKAKLKFKLTSDFSSLKKIFYFARNQFLFNILNYFSRNMDTILIPKFISSTAIGNYNKAYQLLMYPATILNGVINPVLQPVLSDYQDDEKLIDSTFLKLIHYLIMIGMPMSVFFSFNAKEIIFFVFGMQWGKSVIPFSLLSTTVWIQIVLVSTSAIFQVKNKTKYLVLSGWINAILITIAVLIGVSFKSINYVAAFISFSYVVSFCSTIYILYKRVIQCSLNRIIRIFISPVVISVLMIVVFFGVKYTRIFGFTNNYFVLLVLDGLVWILLLIIGILITEGRDSIVKALNLMLKRN